MKRSEIIWIGATVLVAGGIWLAERGGGERNTEANVYKDVEECMKAGGYSASDCATSFSEAKTAAMSDAPQFRDESTCEATYGTANCQAHPFTAGYFVPALAGFAIARTLSGGAGDVRPLYPGTGSERADCSVNPTLSAARPECAAARARTASSSSSGRSWSTGSGSSFRSSGSGSRASVPMFSSSSRGGFGSTGHGFSSSS